MAHLLGRRNRRRILLISRSEVRFQLPRFFCDLNDPSRGAAPHDETYFDFSSEHVFVTNRDRAASCRSLRIPETRATSDGIATPRLAQLGDPEKLTFTWTKFRGVGQGVDLVESRFASKYTLQAAKIMVSLFFTGTSSPGISIDPPLIFAGGW